MKLSVFERLNLLSIFPTEGSFTNLKIVRKAREDLSFSDKENKLLNFQQLENNQISWTNNVVGDKEVNLGEVAKELIKKALKKLDKEEKLTETHFSLYEKFIRPDSD